MAMKPISIAIVGDDRGVQRTFATVTRRMADLSSTGERFATGVRKIGDDTGVTKLATGFESVGRRVAGAAESMGRFAPALAGLTGAATIAGVARLVEAWTGFGSRLGQDSNRIGIAARELHGFQGASRLAGSSAEAMAGGLETLGQNLTDAVGGRSPETIQMLSSLGIAFQDASGHARKAGEVFPELADRIAKITNPALKVRASAPLGSFGRELLPLLNKGSAGISELTAQTERYGLMNDRGVASAQSMANAQERLGLAAEGVGYAISERVAPVLVPMLNRVSDWVAAHREEIGDFLKRVADGLQRWVDTGGLELFLQRMQNTGTAIGKMVTGVQDFGTKMRTVFDTSIEKIEAFYAWMQKITGWGPPAWMKRILGIDDAGGAPAIADPQAGLLNGRLFDALPPEQRRLFAPPPVSELSTPRERIGAGLSPRNYPSEISERAGLALPAGEAAARARYGFDRYVSQGDTPQVAAGRIANLLPESGMNDRAVGDGGAAYGLGQHHEDRRRAFTAMYGHDMRHGTFDEQLDFFRRDPDIGAQRANQLIARPGTSAASAAAQISRLNERPADEAGEMRRRGALAESLLKQYTAVPAPAVTPVPPPIAGGGAAGANGTATVRLEHVNPPAGLQTSVQTSGGVQYGGLRIERPQLGSMP